MSSWIQVAAWGLASCSTSFAGPADLEVRIDACVKPYFDDRDFSGAVLVAKGGNILVSKGYGMASFDLAVPSTPRTRFHVASLTKTFTAAAISILRDQGKLDVKDPVAKVIPGYPRGNEITLEHLLLHRSGIPDYNGFPDYGDKVLRHWSLLEVVDWFKDKPLDFKPGERHAYSNANYVLLAHALERVTGERYDDFLRKNVLDPVGLASTGPMYHESIVRDLARGYEPGPGPERLVHAPAYDMSIKVGSGSLYSTTEDLYDWMRAVFTQKLFKIDASRPAYAWPGRTYFGHDAIEQDGSAPGFIAYASWFPKDDVHIVYLGNIGSGAFQALRRDLAAVVFDVAHDPRTARPPIALSPAASTAFVGRYAYPPSFTFTILEDGGELWVRWMSAPNRLHLTPISESTLTARARFADLTFVRDATGKVTSVRWSENGETTECRRLAD